MFSLLNGFLGYNQVFISPEDRLKTMFRTKWGTYMYRKMSLGLINVGSTFKQAMDIYFRGLLGNFVVVYLDYVTVFSKDQVGHITHLRENLDRCWKYGISLNPKKYVFCVTEGKILGFVVSKDGMMIDSERSAVITKLPPPHNKKSGQSFKGKIKFCSEIYSEFHRNGKTLTEHD